MNLLNEDYTEKKTDKTKKMATIILVCIVLIVLIIIGIVSYLMYIQSTQLKVIVDGQINPNVKSLIRFESDGTIYVPIRAISSYLGYNCYNGEYGDKSEDTSRCYVECTGEVANLTLNSNKIYKLNLENTDDNYTYIYMDKPVKAVNGELYITTDGMQKAFNSSFVYDQASNTITINTMTYLINAYSSRVLDYGYTKISESFENQKTILSNMIVVTNDKTFGVVNATDGTEVLECKYDDIVYQESTGDFIVCSDNKYGIIGSDRKTKVNINYDSIELMDYDAGLYLVERNDKYGVIDLNGNTVIHAENDQIGVDISRFEENDLKTGYILVNNLIPAQRSDKWGLFDTKGNLVVNFEYDSLGYIANNSKEAVNLLVIPDYNVIVACLENRYTLLNASGEQPFKAFVDDIYMTISGGEKHYSMIANDRTYDVEDYLDRLGVQSSTNTNTSNTSSNTSTNTSNQNSTAEESSNQVSDETSEENTGE